MSDTEEAAARGYLQSAGYAVSARFDPGASQATGKRRTAARRSPRRELGSLNERADALMEALLCELPRASALGKSMQTRAEGRHEEDRHQ